MFSKQLTLVTNNESTRVKSVAFHPYLPVIVGGNHCGTLNIYNYLYSNDFLKKTISNVHVGSVRCVVIHPSGKLFATAGDDKVVRVWDYHKMTVTQTLSGHTDYVRTLDFHLEKPWIVSGSDDCTIKIWNIYTGELISSSVGHHHYVMSAKFLDSTHIVSGSLDHMIGLWDCKALFNTQKKSILTPSLIQYQTIDAHDRGVNIINIDHFSNLIYSGSDDNSIKVWAYKNESIEYVKTIYAHESNVTDIFTHDSFTYSVGEDSKIVRNSQKESNTINVNETININTNNRLWCIAAKDDVVVAGGDTGIILFSSRSSITISSNENDNEKFNSNSLQYYTVNNKLFSYDCNNNENTFITKVKYNKNDQIFIHDQLLYVAYAEKNVTEIINLESNTHEVVSGIFYKKDMKYNSLEIDSKKYLGTITAENVTTEKITVEIFTDNSTVTFSSLFNELNLLNIDRMHQIDNMIYFISKNKIYIYAITNNILKYINIITEHVEIYDSRVVSYNNSDLLLYATTKHIKYVINNTNNTINNSNIMTSLSTTSKILCNSITDKIFLINYAGDICKIDINTSEIDFKRAVTNKEIKNEEILSILKDKQLPGLSPLNYLIQNNRGSIAIPYIHSSSRKVELYLSESNFNKCMEEVEKVDNKKIKEQLLKKITNKIIEDNSRENYSTVERIHKENSQILSETDRMYFYMASKNREGLRKMRDTVESEEVRHILEVIVLEEFESEDYTREEKESENISQEEETTKEEVIKEVRETIVEKHLEEEVEREENILQEEENEDEEKEEENISEKEEILQDSYTTKETSTAEKLKNLSINSSNNSNNSNNNSISHILNDNSNSNDNNFNSSDSNSHNASTIIHSNNTNYATNNSVVCSDSTIVIVEEVEKHEEEINAFITENITNNIKNSDNNINSDTTLTNNNSLTINIKDIKDNLLTQGLSLFENGKLSLCYDYFGLLLLYYAKQSVYESVSYEDAAVHEKDTKTVGKYRMALEGHRMIMRMIETTNTNKLLLTQLILFLYDTLKGTPHGYLISKLCISLLMKHSGVKDAYGLYDEILNSSKNLTKTEIDKLNNTKTIRKLLKSKTEDIQNIQSKRVKFMYGKNGLLVIQTNYCVCSFCGVENSQSNTNCECCKVGVLVSFKK